MKLPRMVYDDEITKVQQISFRGYNHTRAAGDGEIYDMENLCGLDFPLLSVRPKRRKLATLTKPNGLFGKDKLCWVDGTAFYYNGSNRGTVTDSRKTFAAIGPYIIILPDKKYFNTRALGTLATTGDLNEIEDPKYGDCYAVGAAPPYDLHYWDGSAWTYLMAEFGSLESEWSGAVTFQDGTYQGEAAEGNTIYSSGIDWSDYFRVGDAVTISGCETYTGNNKTSVIREIDGDEMRFYENVFTNGSEPSVTIKRTVPDMDWLCESGNRLWGFRGDGIYASKLGDPFNWNVFDGLATDSYYVDTGSAGDFSGAASYLGYPIGFKPDYIHKIYGSIPKNFEVIPSAKLGVAEGSGRSLAVAGEILFYLSRSGPVAYSGGIPTDMGSVFGDARYKNGVGGSDGLRYYLSMQDGSDNWHLFVYDTRSGLWHREDDTQVLDFAFTDNLYFLNAEGEIWLTGNILNPPASCEEGAITWWAEFADFTDGSMNKKSVSKLQLRLELDEGASVTAYLKYDSEDAWTTVAALTAAKKRSVYIPVVPRRADHYRLKLSGTGGCRIYSLAREIYQGSEF